MKGPGRLVNKTYEVTTSTRPPAAVKVAALLTALEVWKKIHSQSSLYTEIVQRSKVKL